MAKAPFSDLLLYLRKVCGAQAARDLTDAELVERFRSQRDEAAFSVLVHRHGAMVLGVCQRVLGDLHSAEDASQATFLILVRRAASISRSSSVGGWLQAVAQRVAIKARNQETTRRARERRQQQMAPTVPLDDVTWQELRSVLDEEIAGLAEKYRAPLVLCYLEGKSRSQAALELGWPKASVTTRLGRARELLRQRLVRRGITLSTGTLAAVLCERLTGPAVGAMLTIKTVKAAVCMAAGKAVAAGYASAQAVALAKKTMVGIGAINLKLVIVSVAVGVALGGACVASYSGLGFGQDSVNTVQESPQSATSDKGVQKKTEIPSATDLYGDSLPQGALARLGTIRWRHADRVHFLAFLPGDKSVVSAANDGFVRVWELATGKELQRFGPGPETGQNRAEIRHFTLAGGLQPLSTLAAVSSDGKLLATSFDSTDAEIWELATGKKLATIPLDKAVRELAALAFAPTGTHLAMVSATGQFRIWNIKESKMVREFGKAVGGDIVRQYTLTYSPDEKILVSMLCDGMPPARNTIQFWNPETGAHIRSIKVDDDKSALYPPAISPDGKLFAYGTGDAQVNVLRLATGEALQKWKLSEWSAPPHLVFSPDSTRLYSKISDLYSKTSSADCLLQEWEVMTGKLIRTFSRPPQDAESIVSRRWLPVGSLAISHDGKMLVCSDESTSLRFFDVIGDKKVTSIESKRNRFYRLQFAPDGKSLLNVGRGSSFQQWDRATGKLIQTVVIRERGLDTQDGRYMAFLEGNNRVVLWDHLTNQRLAELPRGTNGFNYSFSPDGKILLLWDFDQTFVALYDGTTGKPLNRIAVPKCAIDERRFNNTQAVFSQDSKWLVVYAENSETISIHNLATGLLEKVYHIDKIGRLRSGDLSPDRRLLVLDRGVGEVQFVELATGAVRSAFGKQMASKSNEWRLGAASMEVITFNNFRNFKGASCAFSPDGRLVAFAAPDNTLQVLATATGRLLARFDGHIGEIKCLDFAPDGLSIATAGVDNTALIWDIRGLSAQAGVPEQPLDAAAVQNCWNDLTAGEAKAAHDSINALIGSPRQSVSFLRDRLQPVPALEPGLIAKLVQQLGADQFKIREEAQAQLLKIGDAALPYINKELARNLPLEAKQRLEGLHAKLIARPYTGERLRTIRAIEVLERIGNDDARQLLQNLADGAAGALVTTEAEAALRRVRE
jgi:RNA polymerase sigma factor (sigma-70 family)